MLPAASMRTCSSRICLAATPRLRPCFSDRRALRDLHGHCYCCTCELFAGMFVPRQTGERFVTFDGIAKACAKAMGLPEPELVHFNAKEFDFGKDKPFPMRDQHFFASVDKVRGQHDCTCLHRVGVQGGEVHGVAGRG